MRKSRKRKAYIAFLSLAVFMLVFSSFTSYAAVSSNDASIILTQQKPSSVSGWIRFSRLSSSFGWVSQAPGSLRTNSVAYFFRSVQNFDRSSSFGSNADTLVLYNYTNNIWWETSFVYRISLTLQFNPIYFDYMLTSDWSKILLVFPVDFPPSGDFEASDFSYYFYNGYAPSSYTIDESNTFVTFNYMIPIYPSTSFSQSDVTNGHIVTNGFGIMDSGSGMVMGTSDGSIYRYSQTFIFLNPPVVDVFTPDQYNTLVQQGAIDSLSNMIDQSTGRVISAIDDQTSEIIGGINDAADSIINAGDPIDLSLLENAHQVEDQLINGLYSTSPFSMTAVQSFATRLTSLQNSIGSSAGWTSDWLQYVFEQNIFVQQMIGWSLCCVIMYMSLKAVF